MALILAGDEMWPLTAKGWIAVVLLAVLTGMLGHGLIAFAQREVDVATIGIIQVAQPAIAVCWSFLMLGEAIRAGPGPGDDPRHRRPGRLHRRQPTAAAAAATVVDDQHGELTGPVG